MKFANFLTKVKDFLKKRLAEVLGLLVSFSGLLIFIALLSYSPEDPNFIINENIEIKNLLGFRGSVLSDFLFQSIGLISYLIPFTLFFSGINIMLSKRHIILIDNIFFIVLYIFSGSLFFSLF